MNKLLTFLVGFTCLSFSCFAQFKITGSVNDPSENKPVHNAVIALLTPKDSILYKFTRSNADGKYIIKDVKPGNYILMKTHPYFAEVLEDVVVKGDMEMPVHALISKAKLLQEVIIKTGSPIKIKGDTTVYTADSFKVSANANVEELLKKLPGIQVDKDGKIKAMGETVQKVLVDGEEFFGDDPGMAVKNLRADAVKEVQVFDKKSDQSVFTGIDDGKTQKTINLKLKEDKKYGYFGKIDAAGGLIKGIDPRYKDNLMFSTFKGKRKLSAFLLNGNTGQDGLSWQDEQKYGGGSDNIIMDDDGGIMIFGRGGSSDDEPYLDPQNGYLTSLNTGAQYSNKWKDKYTLNLSPKYNSQDYINHKKTFTQIQVGDSALIENANTTSDINRYNIKNRGSVDIMLDSANSLKISANANFYHTQSSEIKNAVTTGNSGVLKNTSNRALNNNSDKYAYSGNIIFKHKFKKPRRTLSVTADWNLLNTQGKNFLVSDNQAYFRGQPSGIQKLNQLKDYDLATKNLSAKFVYTEPLSKEYSLELGYQMGYNFGTNNQLTYSYSPTSGKYDFAVDSLTNQFKQNILQNIPSAKVNFANKKLKINVGSGFGFTDFDLKDITFNKDYKRTYVNFFPTGNLTYTYKPNHSIRITYNGNTTQPTINQLQPLRNNNDYFNQYIGNPDLKPSFTSTINVSHNSYNFIKDFYTYQSLFIRSTSNYLNINRIINIDSGKTISQPINTRGYYFISFYGGAGFKIKKLDLRVNLNPRLSLNKNADLINGKENFTKTFSPGIDFGLYKSKEKKYEFSINEGLNYTRNFTSQSTSSIHYITNTLQVNATVYYKKVWSIVSDYQFGYRQKTQQLQNDIKTHVLNTRLQRTFKNDEFTAYITVRDILNQNIGVERNFSSNTYREVINDRLKRYFLVGFTWDFKNKAPKAAATK
ncbi:MAG: TonB-dependent receptor family protein [Bacteroidota bacterium]|nr:TonB-dependent receptor family protein [Bacteroidota bacterium]